MYELFLKTYGCILKNIDIGMIGNIKIVQYEAGY